MKLDSDPRHHAHRNPTDTELDAAVAALKRQSENCRRVFRYLLMSGPRTDYELQQELRMHSVRRRRADLKRAGLVEDSGVRRPSPQGRPMIVWQVKRGYDSDSS